MPENSGQHWTNQVAYIAALGFEELIERLNRFYRDKFVIATQVFPQFTEADICVHAIVYYKIPPEAQ